MNTGYTWKETNGPKCPGCGQVEIVNQYGHEQWRCGSYWANEKKTSLNQSNECQRWELDLLHAKIKELSESFTNHLKELKHQDAFKYQPPAGKD